jgi:predicted SnoaL-like aldol condensation-catalyzing enzyme
MDDRKTRAIDFLRLASAGDVARAFDQHVTAGFRHHNPSFAGDGASLMRAMADNARENPHKTCEPLRAIAEGEFVCVHSRVRLERGARPVSVVHLFRFEGDRIAELWDVGQPEPEHMPNGNGMF